MAIQELRIARTAGRLCGAIVVLGLLGGTGFGGVREERAAEAVLTHQRLSFAGVRQWQRKQKTWVPLQRTGTKVLVVNLWSKLCKPCLGELPPFGRIARAWRNRPEVQFAFIADPPNQTSLQEVVEFWQRPEISVPLDKPCPGNRMPLGDGTGCMLEVPDVDPARSDAPLVGPTLRPLTLLVDSHNVIRQVLAGSIEERADDLDASLKHLLAILQSEDKDRQAQPSRPARAPR